MQSLSRILLILSLTLLSSTSSAQTAGQNTYDIGSPTLTEIWVDPVSGNDSRNGNSEAQAYRSLTAAWNRIPSGNLSGGFQINILPGTIPESNIPNYWEEKRGSYAAPIIIKAASGKNTAILAGDINMFACNYVYLVDLVIRPNPAGDAFHCEQCNHILIRGSELDGGNRRAHETIKINQSQYIYIEESNIHGADDNTIDFVAVQYGHIVRSKIHDAQDWCAYAKGGSAQILIEGNEIYNCGTGGFTAGQGTGLEYMTAPWLHYEAYDLKVVNNIIHDTQGAGLGVNGGYNILLAFNTLYKIGERSHMLEVVFGERSCDGNAAACNSRVNLGAWGPRVVIDSGSPIGNKNVFVLNNILMNPTGSRSGFQHLAIYDRRTPAAGSSAPSPAIADANLVIKGNLIWNGPTNFPIGVEDNSNACVGGTCSASQIISNNSVNTIEPTFRDVLAGDYRPSEGSALATVGSQAIDNFLGGDRQPTPLAPEGVLANSVLTDRGGAARTLSTSPGAYARFDSEITSTPGTPVGDTPSVTPGDSTAPSISSLRVTPTTLRKGANVSFSATVTDVTGVTRVTAKVGNASATLKKGRGNTYSGKVKVTRIGTFSSSVIAQDAAGNRSTRAGSRVKVTR